MHFPRYLFFPTMLAASALALSACGEESGSAGTTSATTHSATTSNSTSLSVTTKAASAASPTATAVTAPVSAAGIKSLGNANDSLKTQRVEAPAQLLVTGVRTGKHEGFERVVFDLEGTGQPGWFVDFSDKPAQQGSGNPISVQGNTFLNVNIDGTVLPFELGKEDPQLGTVAGQGGIVTEVVSTGTFEGRSQFFIGLHGRHPYSVQTLENPTRLVIDIQVGS